MATADGGPNFEARWDVGGEEWGAVNGVEVQGRVAAVMKQGFVKVKTLAEVPGSRQHERRRC